MPSGGRQLEVRGHDDLTRPGQNGPRICGQRDQAQRFNELDREVAIVRV